MSTEVHRPDAPQSPEQLERWRPRGGELLGKSFLVEVDEIAAGPGMDSHLRSQITRRVAELVMTGKLDDPSGDVLRGVASLARQRMQALAEQNASGADEEAGDTEIGHDAVPGGGPTPT